MTTSNSPNTKSLDGLYIFQHRGSKISKVFEDREAYFVPSQTRGGTAGYTVNIEGTTCTCTCPDWTENHLLQEPYRCKHVWAALYHSRKIPLPAGVVATQRKAPTTQRDWGKYNNCQEYEFPDVKVVAGTLNDTIRDRPYKGTGRRPVRAADLLFTVVMKVFTGLSARRLKGELRKYKEEGFINSVPSCSAIFRFLEDETVTPFLEDLITYVAMPLTALEVDRRYATDSTGFATGTYGSYYEKKHGVNRRANFIKAHVIAGTRTHVVARVIATEGRVTDPEVFPALLKKTVEQVPVAEISGDPAYATAECTTAAAEMGIEPYFKFRKDATGTGGGKKKGYEAWRSMFHHFSSESEEYMRHYHARSNVETVFHMIKAKFGERLKCRSLTAQRNEVLIKFLCLNLSTLVTEVRKLGITATFDRFFKVPQIGGDR